MVDVSIIVVSYNSEAHICACIESVLKQQGVTFEIIVVDNNSQDNTVAIIKSFDDHVQLICSDINHGFAKGCNIAALRARGRYLYFLNPDARIAQNNALQVMSQYMADHSQCGFLGARVAKNAQHRGILPRKISHGEQYLGPIFADLPGSIVWVTGASMIISRPLFQQLNGFDEDFFCTKRMMIYVCVFARLDIVVLVLVLNNLIWR
ncbi:MAG: glycosyltransferase family 2 protein [Pseudomonadota bacterium]